MPAFVDAEVEETVAPVSVEQVRLVFDRVTSLVEEAAVAVEWVVRIGAAEAAVG